jgi:hypothetical protein
MPIKEYPASGYSQGNSGIRITGKGDHAEPKTLSERYHDVHHTDPEKRRRQAWKGQGMVTGSGTP